LFVQESGRDQCEDFALAWRQRAEALLEIEPLSTFGGPRARALHSEFDCCHECFVGDRFPQNIHSARLHHLNY
jgi:hypothetical protein